MSAPSHVVEMEPSAPAVEPKASSTDNCKWSCSCGRCFCFCLRLPCHPIRAPFISVMVLVSLVVLLGYGVHPVASARVQVLDMQLNNSTLFREALGTSNVTTVAPSATAVPRTTAATTRARTRTTARSAATRPAAKATTPTTLEKSQVAVNNLTLLANSSKGAPKSQDTPAAANSLSVSKDSMVSNSSTLTNSSIALNGTAATNSSIALNGTAATNSSTAGFPVAELVTTARPTANQTRNPYEGLTIPFEVHVVRTGRVTTSKPASGVSASNEGQRGTRNTTEMKEPEYLVDNPEIWDMVPVESNRDEEEDYGDHEIVTEGRSSYNFSTIRSDAYSQVPSQLWRQKAAAYGILLHPYGQGHSFDKAFEHVIVVRWEAFENVKKVIEAMGPSCTSWDEKLYMRYDTAEDKKTNRSTGRYVRDQLAAHCHKFARDLKSMTKVFVNNNLPATKFQRPKRLIIAITVGVLFAAFSAGMAAGMVYQQTEINRLTKDFESLSTLVNSQNIETVLLRDNLVGLTQILQERGTDLTSAVSALEVHQDYFHAQLTEIGYRLGKIARSDTITVTQLMHLTEITHANLVATGVLQATIAARQEFQQALLSLKLGLLPSSVVTFQKLHEILEKVESELPDEYMLGIPLHQIENYYLLSLARFAVVDNHLQIRLSIPLVYADRGERAVTFYQPINKPFHQQLHTMKGQKNHNLILKEREMSHLWAWDDRTKQAYEASQHNWVCAPRGMTAMCYSFHPSSLKPPRPCFGVLANGSFEDVVKACSFDVTEEPYQPLDLGNGSYAVHVSYRNRSFDVREHCANRAPYKLPLNTRRPVNIVHIDPGCYLMMADHLVGGPLLEQDEDTISVASGFMPLTSVNTSLEYGNDTEGYALKNLTRIKVSYDNERLTQITDSILSGTERIRQRMLEYEQRRSQPSGSIGGGTGFLSLINVLWDLFLTVLVLALLMAVVRQGKWLYIVSPVIIVRQNGAQAFQIPTLYAVIGEYALPSFWPAFELALVLEYICRALCVLAMIAACYWSVWRRVYLSTHTASTVSRGKTFRFWLQINFEITRHTLFGQYEQQIILRVPVKTAMPRETVGIEVSQPSFLYYISKDHDRLRSAQPLTIRGKFDDGTFSCSVSEPLSVCVSGIAWDRAPLPKGLCSTSYGVAHVLPIGDPAPML